MGLLDALRGRSGHRSTRLVGRIADDPQIVEHGGVKYMVFHLTEVPGTEFHLKVLPTTPKRRRGDRVELSYQPGTDGSATVEALTAAPDAGAGRRRAEEYLESIKADDARRRQ